MIVDTSVMVSAVERKSAEAIAAIQALPGPSLWCFVVAGELAAGVEAATLLGLPPEDINMRASTADAYARLSRRSAHDALDSYVSHFGWLTSLCACEQIRVGQNDRWIVAMAIAHETQVITADVAMHTMGEAARESLGSDPVTHFVAGCE